MSREQALAEHRQRLGLEEVSDHRFETLAVEGGSEVKEHAFISGMMILDRELERQQALEAFGIDRRSEPA
jgi:hypothetical protein